MKHADWPAAEITKRRVADLAPSANNSRTHSAAQVEQIAASITEWGWTIPVLIDEEGTIIAGHGRIMAAEKLGIKQVPCMVARGWTDEQKRAYLIADNKLALNAEWDVDVLKVELGDLLDTGFDLSLIGFSNDELVPLVGIADEVGAPNLKGGDREPFRTMTVSLHDSQFEVIERAINSAKSAGFGASDVNPNSNGNALAHICEEYCE